MHELTAYYELWKKGPLPEAVSLPVPAWPEKGIAFLGDFSGIQNFVFRPIPGAGGAARRLRSRSFCVSAYTELIARWSRQQLAGYQPQIFYSAGGRFLLIAATFDQWPSRVQHMQAQIDHWAWTNFQGDMVFHLGAAEFSSRKIPYERLMKSLQTRRAQPLNAVLQSAGNSPQWSSAEFFQIARPTDGRCAGCGMTRALHSASAKEQVCDSCRIDEELGQQLTGTRYIRLDEEGRGQVSALNFAMQVHHKKPEHQDGMWLSLEESSPEMELWPLLRHVPLAHGGPLDFDDIAKKALGAKKWLGYLRLDIDHAGKLFAGLNGDPARTWSLSNLLNRFFTLEMNGLLQKQFSNIYAVYGGGDDLFVIGPWNETLDFALALRSRLVEVAGHDLAFSAGLSLAKPKEHILTHARIAGSELQQAKTCPAYARDRSRDQIRALGVTLGWDTFARLLPVGKQIMNWLKTSEVTSSFLHEILQLHRNWKNNLDLPPQKRAAPVLRYRPLLYYQIQRNLKPGPARQWAHSLLHSSHDWPWADFIVQYAMLGANRSNLKGD